VVVARGSSSRCFLSRSFVLEIQITQFRFDILLCVCIVISVYFIGAVTPFFSVFSVLVLLHYISLLNLFEFLWGLLYIFLWLWWLCVDISLIIPSQDLHLVSSLGERHPFKKFTIKPPS